MAKNSLDVYGAAGKSNVLFFDPDKLHLVTDPESPLYDERVHNPPKERVVRSIMAKGVKVTIIVAKNPETGLTEVVDGRQRVINAREANRRLVERGDEPVHVPATVQKWTGNGVELAETMVMTNELREQFTPSQRARHMQALADRGRDDEAIGLAFGVSAQTVRSTLALLDMPKVTRDAVDAGEVTLTQAKQLAKLSPEEQRAKVAELAAAAEGEKPHARAKRQREVLGTDKPKMRSRAEVQKLRDDFDDHTYGRSLLDWVLGLSDERPNVAKSEASAC